MSLFTPVGLSDQLLDGPDHSIDEVGMTSDLEERSSLQDKR